MANKMLIDASHPEETRVVVLRGNRIEEFDFESSAKKPLRGNIYLAKVTRVEPSLQAAFIDYDGNRHGFLAFSEIHPDYYQIPIADRQALLEEEANAHKRESEREDFDRQRRKSGGRNRQRPDTTPSAETQGFEAQGFEGIAEEAHHDTHENNHDDGQPSTHETDFAARSQAAEAYQNDAVLQAFQSEADNSFEPELNFGAHDNLAHHEDTHNALDSAHDIEDALHDSAEDLSHARDQSHPQEFVQEFSHDSNHEIHNEAGQEAGQDINQDSNQEAGIEHIGGVDGVEEIPRRQSRLRRQYKIQEVIKRRQILLVQVVKEERGNKGAALTTYLSLAGRYCVLMPNTARGGGISRKITDNEDRDRLRSIVQELEVPEGMGVILRTAGATRTRQEIRRDFEYLMRMWEQVRETTLNSVAPTLVYEEGTLIKRTIRDLYNKDIDEIIVAGEEAYREARDYMAMLMPSDVDCVKLWSEPESIFARTGVEAQLDGMFSNRVTLKSGGYLIINQTEALVAIDVNSGRSTREHNIEDTALRTNLEAADEVARQLRLRDLAGLVVIDFIDMEEGRNNRLVERRIKEALRNDRARIQVGRISPFGLLEISRQRMRTGVLEGSTIVCPHCQGSGTIRSTSSIALYVLRAVEDTLIRSAAYHLIVRAHSQVALYILNQKRAHLHTLEVRFGITISILTDETLDAHEHYRLERGELALVRPTPEVAQFNAVSAPHAVAYQTEALETDTHLAQAEPAGEDNFDESEEDNQASSSDEVSDYGAANGFQNRHPRKRRRRRSSRNGGERSERAIQNGAAPDILIDSEQPSDEGLAYVAGLKPTPHARSLESFENEGDEEPTQDQDSAGKDERSEGRDGNRRGSRRLFRGGRRRNREGQNREGQNREGQNRNGGARYAQDAGDGNSNHAQATNDVRDSTPVYFEPAPTPPMPVVPAAERPATPAAPTTIISVEPENKPKRSGWWQRAKATFTGEES